VQQAMKLKPRYLSMIIPARWYAGGKGLDDFRSLMLGQRHIRKLVDVANSADCFPGVNVAGGICYFLWDSTYTGECTVVNMKEGKYTSEQSRSLDEFEYFVRSNLALSIIRKVLSKNEKLMSSVVYSRNYFSLPTTVSGSKEPGSGTIKVLTSKGTIYLHKSSISDKQGILNKYKVIITYAMSGGNKPTSEGNYQILSSLKALAPGEACTETYLILDVFNTKEEAENMVAFMAGKLSRFLLLQALTSIHITKDKFCFVPYIGFAEATTDDELYVKYGLSEEEIAYVESMIKSMDTEV
jgi:site-specific DNA-methyltransferase (adenine-specific)